MATNKEKIDCNKFKATISKLSTSLKLMLFLTLNTQGCQQGPSPKSMPFDFSSVSLFELSKGLHLLSHRYAADWDYYEMNITCTFRPRLRPQGYWLSLHLSPQLELHAPQSEIKISRECTPLRWRPDNSNPCTNGLTVSGSIQINTTIPVVILSKASVCRVGRSKLNPKRSNVVYVVERLCRERRLFSKARGLTGDGSRSLSV
ncbi:hypothetical protein EVAR_33502_1 [Eumeta japonica]|uniref:Uncharacterized protein n=1 Tax=Eumeta variegata TaxID=151549 RepID=A0A4C1WED1_EUMVA|nr:hypothetical protein EVAR_33502_1 [Eumeta japonica]